jgi:hypothetical protein
MFRLTCFRSLLLVFCCAGCGQHPKIDVVPSLLDDRVVFDITAAGIRDVQLLRVDDENRMAIWGLSLHGHGYKRIEYGILPEGGLSEARQTFPLEGKAPANIRGQTVVVKIQYQYDAIAPSVGSFEKTVHVP